MIVLAQAVGPVIPNFGGSNSANRCEAANRLFCPDWFTRNWNTVLWPALREHIVLTLIAVAIGFVIALALALFAYRYRAAEQPIAIFTGILYTIPSIALFELLVSVKGFGLSTKTVLVALVSYTLLILFRNILAGLRAIPDDVREAAHGMGMTRRQMLLRVELPLALPAMVAGLRIATVTVISLATIGAYLSVTTLGTPIFDAINRGVFKTELIAAGAMAVGLAILADALLVGAQRLLTPWARVQG